MRSLAWKLTLAFLIVGLAGAGLVAFAVGQRTYSEFDRFIRSTLVADLTHHYTTTGSWEGVGRVFSGVARFRLEQPERRPTPLILLDVDRRVVYSGGRYPVGTAIPPEEHRQAVAIQVDGDPVGWLVIDWHPDRASPESPETAFLARMVDAIVLSALGATVVALLLGVLLARTLSRPIQELTVATRTLARGKLGAQVAVRSRDELGELAASFNQMSTDLAHANQLRRQMTADIAHDLRTPLSVILGYTEALADGKFQGSPELFAIMHDEAQHLSHLIDDLRTLSLADAGELVLTRRPVEPRALLERTALAHMIQAREQNVVLAVEAASDLPDVDVDPERMAQVLGNLVGNALRYTPAGGHIVLAARSVGNAVTLEVQDDGAGIAARDLPHVFERFYRADRSRHQNGESGLGLAIAKSIVEAHGGTVSAASVLGTGATFTVELPQAGSRRHPTNDHRPEGQRALTGGQMPR